MENIDILNRIIAHPAGLPVTGKSVKFGYRLSTRGFGIPDTIIEKGAGFPENGLKSKNSRATGKKNGFGCRKDPMPHTIDSDETDHLGRK
jgi:hypothetical protein